MSQPSSKLSTLPVFQPVLLNHFPLIFQIKTYLIFVPQNFSTALHQLTGLYVSAEWFLVVMVFIQIPLSWIRDIRKLTMTNFLANALILYGLITCLVLSLKQAVSVPPPPTIGANDTAVGALVVEESPLAIVEDRLMHLAPFAKDWFLFIGTSVSHVKRRGVLFFYKSLPCIHKLTYFLCTKKGVAF